MRSACLVCSLLALVAAGCGSSTAPPVAGTAPPAAAAVTGDVSDDVARAELTAAGVNVTTWYAQHATYAGAPTGLPTVTLARADATSWCVQDASEHLSGPGGAIAPGPCG